MDNDKIIEVNLLNKNYGKLQVLKDVSFSVKRKSIFAFLGPNGAGKSTTIKILTTILKADSGMVLINGKDPEKESDEVRKNFGIVFQDPSVDEELTAYENLDMHGIFYHVPKKERLKRIEELLKIVELWDRKNELVKNFSGGMKRRLEIARGLLHYPRILFLDEPTVGLDPQTRNHIWNYILKINKREGTTIFFTTHYMDEAERYADSIAIIDRGEIIDIGTTKELMERTKTRTLEEAFIKITGYNIRDEEASTIDRMRLKRRHHK
ncbi:MAG TPA: ATP-binding cassette domain-containing protein [archaeon]|jgi:ABC-2 type transport system ATP-binding protein|nr:ATP-binding cassette domain-containing protein [archaeon]HPV66610.1 ATP-binding cassette domain-containing protein [archaeon]